MSNYAVLLYKFTPNIEGIPGDWPCEVRLIEEGASVEAPWLIMTKEDYDSYISNPELLAQKEAWNIAQAGAATPSSYIIEETVACSLPEDDPHRAFFAFIPSESGDKVRVIEGMPFTATITIKDPTGSSVVPLTDNFALPITGEGMPTQLLFIQFINGVATVNLQFPVTGLYEITQETINRELPIDSHFSFRGLKMYVLKMPS